MTTNQILSHQGHSHPPKHTQHHFSYTDLFKSAVALLATAQDSSNHFYWNKRSNKTKKGCTFDFLKTTVISPLAWQHTWCSYTKWHTVLPDYEYAQPTSFKPTLEHTAPREQGRSLNNVSHLSKSRQNSTYGTINTTRYYTSFGTSTWGHVHPLPNSRLNST